MADYSARIRKAKEAGYSDAEIAASLMKDADMATRIKAAREAGYSDNDIVRNLGKPRGGAVIADAAKSGARGVGEGVAGLRGGGAADVAALRRRFTPQLPDNPLTRAAGAAQQVVDLAAFGPSSAAITNAMGLNHTPETKWGERARTLGQMVPNAMAPGGVVRRAASVALPAALSQGAGEVAEALGANPLVQAGARFVGGLAGGLGASVRSAPRTPEGRAARVLAERAGADPQQMLTRAAEMRQAGVNPMLTDVIGEKGRRVIRAVGVKSQEAGETLANNARRVSSTAKPAVMQRTRGISSDPRTKDELVEALFQARDDAATTNYRDAYATPVKLDPNIIRALSDEPGKAALRRARQAAVARMDDARVAEIDSILAGEADTVSAATLDRTRIAMRERADTAANRGARDTAGGLRARQGMIDQTLEQVPELGPARADYRAKSQAIDVLGKGRRDVFSTDPTDYQAWVASLSPEAREANKVAIRQEIMDTLGGQRSSTFGTVDELATSEYARQNLAAALGPEEAQSYLANLTARLDQVRNARFVSPNDGSRTAVLENDLSGVMETAKAVGQAARGDVLGGGWRILERWLLNRGVSDQSARIIAEAAVDDTALTRIVAEIEAQRPGAGQEFLALRQAIVAGGATSSLRTNEERQDPR